MKKLILAAAVTAAFAANVAHAEDKKPDNEVAYNIGVVSEYRYRGISQSRFQPALQGGVDYTNNPTGIYLGTWLSTIKWIKDAGGIAGVDSGSTPLEWDFYGGKRGDLTKDITYDVGGLYYYYMGNHYGNIAGSANANTFEIYGQLGMGPAYVKYSHSLTNTFGFGNSKNSNYLDVGANIDLPVSGLQLNLHAGHQTIKNYSPSASYTDWKIGLTKDFGVVSGSIAYLGTNANSAVYPSPDGKNLGRSTLWLSLLKTF